MAELIVLGVIVSVIFYEITDITPGGIIIPGLLLLYIAEPLRIVYTVAVAIVASLIVRLLSRYLIIFGKRRFALLVIICFILHAIINLIAGNFVYAFSDVVFSLVGYTAAGVIANNIYKQGTVKTVGSLAIVLGVLYLITLLLSAAGVAVW